MARRFRRKKRFRRRRRKMPIVKLIKKVMLSQAEHKFKQQITVTTSVTDVAPIGVILNEVSEGATVDGRVGFVCKSSSIKIRYHLVTSTSAVIAVVRVYIIQNTTNDNAQNLPDIGELFPTIVNSEVKYNILYDRTHQMSLGIAENIYVNLKLRKFPTNPLKFDSPFGNDFVQGKIVLHVVTDNKIAGDVNFDQHIRHTWTDL